MDNQQFSISAPFNYAWDAVKKHFPLFLSILVIVGLVLYFMPYLRETYFQANWDKASLSIYDLFYFLIANLITVGIVKIFLKIYDNQAFKFSELFTTFKPLIFYILTLILYGLIILGGLILLIVPGFIWALKYSQAVYAVIDKQMTPIAALKYSGNLTNGYKARLFWFFLLSLILLVIGGALVFNGFSVFLPVVYMAEVYLYRQLEIRSQTIGAPVPIAPANQTPNIPTPPAVV